MRRCMESAPRADRDRQTGVHPASRRGGSRSAGDRRDGRRHGGDHARRQDGRRRVGEAVQGRGRARPPTGRTRPSARRRLRIRLVTDLRPRRSVLYMPAANQRALEKAKTLPADAIIFDLEDAVAPDAKESARVAACDATSSGQYGRRELTIRCNGLDTAWGAADLAAIAASSAAAVVVPKVGSVAYLDDISGRLDD